MDTTTTAVEKAESADGTLIAYEHRGDGAPLVLVSGALCTSASEAPLAELLSPHFTVFTYDRRGRGASGDLLPYAVEREIEDLAAVIAAAGGSAAVHGTSSGAALALRAAAAGLPITRLSLYEPPFETDPAARDRNTRYVRRMRELLTQGRRGDALAAFLEAVGMPPQALAGLRLLPMWSAMEALAHPGVRPPGDGRRHGADGPARHGPRPRDGRRRRRQPRRYAGRRPRRLPRSPPRPPPHPDGPDP